MAFITAEAMEELINKNLEKHGIDLEKDHEATVERHKEIMELIEKTAQEMQEAREKSERQMMDAQDVSEALSVSKSTAYAVIRRLNEELEKAGYITVRGKVSRAYFEKRTYGVKVNAG